MFAMRIKQLRKDKGMTQSELANILKCSLSKVAMWETEKRDPTKDDLILLSAVFDVTTDYLLGRTDNPKLTVRDEKSIQKDLKQIIDDFKTGQAGPVFYNGEELSKHDLGVLEEGMELILQTIKLKNKEKYTPKKYKKD